MNFFNISRATQGLVAYLQEWNSRDGNASAKTACQAIVIAHDPRFFSKEFAELAAKVASENGCDAFVFAGPRPCRNFRLRSVISERARAS